ncbi:hypothetical protein [Pseudomonas sp. On1]|uniref:hypothetical protein n=1 Tax=Pseudomonas sp. On1 TaxID=3083258 RepID=UPI0029A58BB8|nr:hypothetical protein [Pseudomonas sp. On1]MDX2309802.1 hypothetical protein [Pseudomonas sp. On1]
MPRLHVYLNCLRLDYANQLVKAISQVATRIRSDNSTIAVYALHDGFKAAELLTFEKEPFHAFNARWKKLAPVGDLLGHIPSRRAGGSPSAGALTFFWWIPPNDCLGSIPE